MKCLGLNGAYIAFECHWLGTCYATEVLRVLYCTVRYCIVLYFISKETNSYEFKEVWNVCCCSKRNNEFIALDSAAQMYTTLNSSITIARFEALYSIWHWDATSVNTNQGYCTSVPPPPGE